MIGTLLTILKIVFILGFLIIIHEGGHFLVAKLCKVKVNEFAIGFGPLIFQKKGKETLYSLRLIPLGGFVSMEGENEASEVQGSFSKASIPKRIAIVVAGAVVNIVFGIALIFILLWIVRGNAVEAVSATGMYLVEVANSLKEMFTGNVSIDQFTGPVGISNIVAQTSGMIDFTYILAVISLSLGVTNLLPIPALDGGKIVILLIEAIRRKPMKQETEIAIQTLGFFMIILLSVYVTYHDIVTIW